jgi:hypothetical protein
MSMPGILANSIRSRKEEDLLTSPEFKVSEMLLVF